MKKFLKKHQDFAKGYKIENLICALILPHPIPIKVFRITICIFVLVASSKNT